MKSFEEDSIQMGKVAPVGDTLLEFLEDWLCWASSPDTYPSGNNYMKRLGLCASLMRWCGQGPKFRKYNHLSEELKFCFSKAGLNKYYPFGEKNFNTRLKSEDQHLDPLRLAWVKETIHVTKGIRK